MPADVAQRSPSPGRTPPHSGEIQLREGQEGEQRGRGRKRHRRAKGKKKKQVIGDVETRMLDSIPEIYFGTQTLH